MTRFAIQSILLMLLHLQCTVESKQQTICEKFSADFYNSISGLSEISKPAYFNSPSSLIIRADEILSQDSSCHSAWEAKLLMALLSEDMDSIYSYTIDIDDFDRLARNVERYSSPKTQYQYKVLADYFSLIEENDMFMTQVDSLLAGSWQQYKSQKDFNSLNIHVYYLTLSTLSEERVMVVIDSAKLDEGKRGELISTMQSVLGQSWREKAEPVLKRSIEG